MESKIVTTEMRENIDWCKPQLVIYESGPIIKVVIANGVHGEYSFHGQLLYSTIECEKIGFSSRTWDKEYFKPFHGQITITS